MTDKLELAVSRLVRELAQRRSRQAKEADKAKDQAFRKCNAIARRLQGPMPAHERPWQEQRLHEALEELRRLSND